MRETLRHTTYTERAHPGRNVVTETRIKQLPVRPRTIDGMSTSAGASHVGLASSSPVVLPQPTSQKRVVSMSKGHTPKPLVKRKPMPHKSIEQLSIEQKQASLEKALLLAKKEIRKEKRKVKDLKRSGLIFVTGIFVLLTGYASLTALLTNSQAKTEAGSQQASGDSSDAAVITEGQDETKPTAASLSSYAVAADLPRALYIDKLDIGSRILPMGINKDGSVQAPLNIYDAGWYTNSMKPGQIGASFIDGHASGPTHEGLFAYLDTLVVGDTLQVEMGDYSRLTYKVVHTEVVPLEGFDMKKALLPHDRTLRGLNIMTCTGEWVKEKNTYDHRVIVYTEQI